jgi:hypothetical protein
VEETLSTKYKLKRRYFTEELGRFGQRNKHRGEVILRKGGVEVLFCCGYPFAIGCQGQPAAPRAKLRRMDVAIFRTTEVCGCSSSRDKNIDVFLSLKYGIEEYFQGPRLIVFVT